MCNWNQHTAILMSLLKIQIDGKEITAEKGTTIFEAAEKSGIRIPTLCHHRGLLPSGSCRICVVEVEGSNRLIGSCHTPVTEGMVIQTQSSAVLSARKATVELLLAGHTGPCVSDSKAARCDLHKIASDLQVGSPRFRVRKPRFYAPEDTNPYVRRDMSKCILCSRCVWVCNTIAKKGVLGTAYRGFHSKIVVDFDTSLDKEVCRDCLLCIEYCPTSALTTASGAKAESKKAAGSDFLPLQYPVSRQRSRLLPELKKAQDIFRCVPQGFMTDTAVAMDLPLSDVFGVSTFYSFLSRRPKGENIIRVCRSLPCYLKNSETILRSISDTLGIRPGETTEDGLFSLELANCIGACDQAPAMLINKEVFGNLTPRKINRILKSYKSGEHR